MKRLITTAALLCAIAQLSAQQTSTQTTTYSASLSGIKDCQLVQLTVTRTVASPGETRSWLSYTIKQCAAGSSDPSVIVSQANTVIPDSEYVIGRSSERLRTSAGGAVVDVTWTVTADVHQTFSGQWVNETRGQTVKENQATDTKSASVIGSVAGKVIDGRSAYVLTASQASVTK